MASTPDDDAVPLAPSWTVVIADDDAAVRLALSELLVDQAELAVVGVVDDGWSAVEVCAAKRPHVAVVDVMMDGGGRDAVEGILRVSPATTILVYTARSDRRTRQRMLEAGAADVVVKGSGRDFAEALLDLVTVAHRSGTDTG